MNFTTDKGSRYLKIENVKAYNDMINALARRNFFRTGKLVDRNSDGSYVERLEFYNKKTGEKRYYTAKFTPDINGVHNVTRYMLEIL